MKVQGTYRESYNNQIIVDSKNAMIVANDVTNNSADYKMLKSILIQTINNSPENKKQKVIKVKYLNNAGYYSIDNLIWGNANGLDIYIPDSSNKDIFRNTDNLKRRLCNSLYSGLSVWF